MLITYIITGTTLMHRDVKYNLQYQYNGMFMVYVLLISQMLQVVAYILHGAKVLQGKIFDQSDE